MKDREEKLSQSYMSKMPIVKKKKNANSGQI